MLKKLKENFDEYNLKARVYPTIIGLLPIFLFVYFFLHDIGKVNAILSFLSGSALTIIILSFLSDVVRNLGKYLELKMFKNELFFPTTEFLLHSNQNLSKEKRANIYDKVGKHGCVLCSAKEENRDETEARRKIKEAVGMVRQKIGDGRLVLGFNIRYGFWRNLIGISLFSSSVSIFGLIFFYGNYIPFSIFIVLTLFYLGIFIFKKELLKFFGYQYTEQLFLEFLNIN